MDVNGRSTRRDALRLLGLGTAAALMPRLAFATANTDKRFVFFILRGGMDGLGAIIPVGDPGYARVRGEFLDQQTPVMLDNVFGLHASLAPLKRYYDAGDLLPLHAVASSHRERSHFAAQDVLEAGIDKPNSSTSGWLNRLLAEHEAATGRKRQGLALGATMPFALRGPVMVDSSGPDTLPGAPSAFVDRMMALWSEDAVLGQAMADVQMASMDGSRDMGPGGGLQAVVKLAKLAASRLAQPNGPRIAVIEMNGFDTHSAEANRLRQQFDALTQSLTALAEGLQPVWHNSVILAVSEFGRTVIPNGSGGTDHGTGGAGFMLGGAVKGGRVYADWPGLKQGQLFESRDLRPTLSMTALYKAVASSHFGLDGAATMARLFPDDIGSRAADIIRT
ncbi:MAG: DUF1501 domain-containing protein [Ferrovibrio sp.]